MPIALDPSETFDFVLESDKGKPDPPALVFHHLTRREMRKVDAAYTQLRTVKDEVEAEQLFDEIIALGIAGWRNMKGRDGKPIPFAPDAVEDVLTLSEKREVAFGYVTAGMELEALKKKSPSQPTSVTASSAPAAAPLPAA